MTCPICHRPAGSRLLRARDTHRALRRMTRFWTERARASGSPDPNVTQGDATEVWSCAACGSLWRPRPDPDCVEQMYEGDEYGREALDHLYERARRECETDADWLVAQGLTPGASVLEIGSYVGGFCAFARERGCMVVGTDVSPEMVAFCRERGLDVRQGTVGEQAFPPASFDGVWVLNCFEQLPDLDEALAAVRLMLRPGGRVVIRTPNAAFVRRAHDGRRHALVDRFAATNHVLGVPFLHCLSAGGLVGLLRRHGFDGVVVRGREFASYDAPELPLWWRAVRPVRAVARRKTPPWLDVTAHRASSDRTHSIVSASAGDLSVR